MATMKSQASSFSSFTYEWTYDVFINSRGKDTRLGFTRHLYKALCAKKVNVFIDDQDLEKGAEITPTLIKAIQESKIALVIFPKNYAESTYCLEELAMIMECSKVKGMLVWPVFYQVDPAEVRHHQKGSYAEALAKHETRNYGEHKLERWKLALEIAANLSGWHFRSDGDRYEDELIENIIQSISEKISSLRAGDKNQGVESISEISKLNTHSGSNPPYFVVTSDHQIHHNNCPSQQPKPQSSRSKNRGGENLPDKRVHSNKTTESIAENSNIKPNAHLRSNRSYFIRTSDNQLHYIDRDSPQQPKSQSSRFKDRGGEYLPDKRVDYNKSISSSPEVIGIGGGVGYFQGAYPQQCMDCMMNQPMAVWNNITQQMMHGQPPNMAVNYMYPSPYTYPPFPPPGP